VRLDVVIDSTIEALPSLAPRRGELERLSNSLHDLVTEVAIGRYVAGVVRILNDVARTEPEPPPDAKGWP
jgi:hypothetical protein